MSTGMLDEFKAYLEKRDIELLPLSQRQSFAVTKRWTATFARDSDNLTETHGWKAVDRWLAMAEQNLVLLFLSSKIKAFPISQNHRPCLAYRYNGPSVDLSNFNELEFAVFPDSYAWTLIHTHEDGSCGGPYFLVNRDSPATGEAPEQF